MTQTAKAIHLSMPTENDRKIGEILEHTIPIAKKNPAARFCYTLSQDGCDTLKLGESSISWEHCNGVKAELHTDGRATLNGKRTPAVEVLRSELLGRGLIDDEEADEEAIVNAFDRSLRDGYGGGDSDGWSGDVEPISAATAGAAEYPLEMLPEKVRKAIEEAQRGTSSPIPMVACSLLAAGAAAIQSIVEVERPSGKGCRGGNLPVSLWFLIAAESGERKTTTDKIFSAPIREFGDKAILEVVATEPASDEGEEPKKITRRKQLLVTDPTAEGVRDHTHSVWPALYIQSSEGSTILGGHSLRDSQRAAGLGAFNGLWDGEGSYVVRAGQSYRATPRARATVSLAIQPEILGGLTGSDSSSSGFYPRFLISVPPTNIGTRLIDLDEEAAPTPALDQMLQTIRSLLEVKEEWDERGHLVISRALSLNRDAKREWANYYNEIEEAQAEGGDLEGYRGFASKAAEQVLRLAAVIHVLEGGYEALQQAILPETVKVATAVMDYHIGEAMRLDMAVSPKRETERKAATLERWLLEQGKGQPVPVKDILWRGPNSLRDKEARDRAIAHLKERNRWREVKNGKRILLETREAVLREAKL
jgi:hypothetical protein